jgi:hypothetical protein
MVTSSYNFETLNLKMIIMSMGWDYVSELRPPAGLLVITQVIYEMKNYGGMISTRENSWFVNQSSLEILQVELSSKKAGGIGEGND